MNWRNILACLPRPLIVLFVFAIMPYIGWLLGIDWSALSSRIENVVEGENEQLSWQTVLIIIGAPVAFILWAFRDRNAQQNLENQRKDINLKEFQEIQMRAAGAMDEKLPEKARETLQIAAIHQLRPFLRGEYGASFRRPAWELLKARLETSHNMACKTSGKSYAEIADMANRGAIERPPEPDAKVIGPIDVEDLREIIQGIRPSPISLAERSLIAEETAFILRSDLTLQKTMFDCVNLRAALLCGLELQFASLIDADLTNAHLENAKLGSANLLNAMLRNTHLEGADLYNANLMGAILNNAHLEGAELSRANLTNAYLYYTHLEGADLNQAWMENARLVKAHMQGANLRVTHLEGADLRGANLQGASLDGANLKGANLSGVTWDNRTQLTATICDNATIFADNWDQLSAEEKNAARQPWIDRGMVHMNKLTGPNPASP